MVFLDVVSDEVEAVEVLSISGLGGELPDVLVSWVIVRLNDS